MSPKSVSFVPKWVPPVIGLGFSPYRLGDPLAADASVSHAELQAASETRRLKRAHTHSDISSHLIGFTSANFLQQLMGLAQEQLPTGEAGTMWPGHLCYLSGSDRGPKALQAPGRMYTGVTEASLLPGAPIWGRGNQPTPEPQCQAPSVPADCV